MKKIILLFILVLTVKIVFAQNDLTKPELTVDAPAWVQKMFEPNADRGEVENLYKQYYRTHDFEKNFYTQYYKHWAMTHARDNNGALFNLPLDETKFSQQKYLQNAHPANSNKAVVWQCIGPLDFDHHAASTSYAPGAAHVYTVEQSTLDANILYCGTANAGVWKSTDKGSSWTNLTKDMMLTKVRALEIDFTNPQIVYFNSIGKIFKTTDGGATWNPTGDAAFLALTIDANDIIMSQTNNNELWCAAGVGLYHTTDAGANWTQLLSGTWQELEVNPANTNIMYAIKQTGVQTQFYKSTDGGLTFLQTGIGYPAAVSPNEQKRTEISVTPAAPNIIYAFATGATDSTSGLYGIYVSHDAGENWSFQCCGTGPCGVPDTTTNKNLCGWDAHGGDDGGQYYYDLALEVSPFDSNEIHVGAVNHWVSYDGGVNFICPAKWSHSDKPMYVHADIHDIHFYGNNWWIACDGGIFYSSTQGDTFIHKQFGIAGTDFWGFGMGEWDGDEVMVGGTYHNGTQLKDAHVYENDWMSTMGGDNILGAVNYAEPDIIFSDYGRHNLSHNRTVALQSIGSGMQPTESYYVGENGDLEFNPRVWGKVYIGRDTSIWISEDNGLSYQLLHAWGDGNITSIEISPTNPDVMYCCYFQSTNGAKILYRSADGGQSWSDVTPPTADFNNSSLGIPYDIAISGSNENELWLVRTQQSTSQNNLNGYKVFKTMDGGNTWINLTTPMLDGEYITNIEHQRGTNGGVYIGTRRAVYYRNNTMSDWLLYNSGLPISCFSTAIQIDYKNQKVVNAGSRSVWEAPVYESSTSVQAIISVDKNIVHCLRDTVYFNDNSNMADLGATWSWTFPGGTPLTSTLRNPKVKYAATGVYNVTLTVTNSVGTSTQTLNSFISVFNECNADTIPGNCLSLDGSTGFAAGGNLNLNTNTMTMSAWIKPNGVQSDWSGIVFFRGGNTCSGISMKDDNEIRMHWDGTEWGWSSGLFAPLDEWSHVALVVTPDSATLYVNGMHSVNIDVMPVEPFDCRMDIGLDNCCDRYFNGLIDEVCIYNRALTTDEVRELMHLTKIPTNDASLVRYYQFNENTGPILDKIGIAHANMNGGASRVTSSGPFGGGVSYLKNISASGAHNFTGTGFTGNWSSGSTLPDGDVVVSRINLHPDQLPSQNWNARSYWIMDNYGTNSLFDLPQQCSFVGIGTVSASDVSNPNRLKLYLRGHNADGNTWGNIVASANQCTAGADGSVQYDALSEFIESSQMDIVNSSILNNTHELPSENFETGFLVYPNLLEAGNNIHVKTSLDEKCFFVLSDLSGKKLMTISFTHETIVSTKNLAAGFYTYSVMSATYQQNGKVEVVR